MRSLAVFSLALFFSGCAARAPGPPDAPGAPGPAPAPSPAAGAQQGGGLYGQGGWARLAVSMTEGGFPGGELATARPLGSIADFRSEISMLRRGEGLLPGIDNLTPSGAAGNTATEDDPVWDFDLMVALSFYVLQPSAQAPIGVHIGAFADWTRYLGSITPTVGSYQTLGYGGELGAFYRATSGTVVRGAIQAGPRQYRGENADTESETVVNFLVGLEPKLGPVQLGAWAGSHNNQTFVKVGLVFP